MKGNFKRFFTGVVFVLVFVMCFAMLVQASENAEDKEKSSELTWINILDFDYLESEHGSAEYGSSVESYIDPAEKIVHMGLWEDTPYQLGLLIDGVEPKFRMTGKITINDVITEGDISGCNGLRIICGRQDFLNYNTVSLYRTYGAQIVNHSTVGIGDIIPYPEGFAFEKGAAFTFELIRDGLHVTFKLNDTTMIDYTITEAEDCFTEDAYDNIGFISINMDYDVSDLKVEVEGVPPTEQPTAEPTEKPTEQATEQPSGKPTDKVVETPNKVQTNAPNTTNSPVAKPNTGDSSLYVWLVVGVVVVIAVCIYVAVRYFKHREKQSG